MTAPAGNRPASTGKPTSTQGRRNPDPTRYEPPRVTHLGTITPSLLGSLPPPPPDYPDPYGRPRR